MRRFRRAGRFRRALAASVLVLACATPVLGQAPPLDLSPPSEADIGERLAFLDERLEAAQFHGQVWYYGWLTADGIGVVQNSVMAALSDDSSERLAMIVDASKSVIGIGDALVRPLPARLGADPIRELPGGTPELARARLRAAEDLLQRSAYRARLKFTASPHLGNAALNLVGGGIIWAFGEWEDAALSTGIGLLMGELRIWTSPTQPVHDLAEYRARFGGLAAPRDALWSLAPRPNGLVMTLRF